MKTTLPNLKKLAGRGRKENPAASEEIQPNDIELTEAAEPKPPPPLSLFFMLSHLEENGPVRLDGVKLAVCEVMGLELDEPKLGAFAGSLNALDFPVQLLVRQHPPVLQGLRSNLAEAQPEDLPQQTREAADSLGRLLTGLETREGILDRRFYAICEHGRADELRGLLSRAGLGVFPLKGDALRLLVLASALGGSPNERDEDAELAVEINRRDIRVGGHLTRSLHLGKWPRLLAPGFLQGLMAAGAPMDLSVHLDAIPSDQAARTLEWQKVRFESAQSLSLNRGRSLSPEAEIALEDVSRLRDEVQRGRERLFHASLSVTLHADNPDGLKELTQKARAHFAATLGKLDNLAFRQREGLLSTLPLALNAVAVWRTLDTSSLARLFPFSPPDLDTRSGTLYGIDLRACAPIVYDPFDGTHLNANTAVLARSGSGKSFATKLGLLRGVCRGVRAYVIDPEGEYADMARAAGGRVLSPGIAGQGMNPFVIDRGDSEELLQRIGSLRRLIEVMVGERLSAERRSSLDHALAGYYAEHRERTGFRDFYAYLEAETKREGKTSPRLLRPFATGSLRQSPLRRGRRPADPRGAGHRLRPAPAGTGASSRRRDGLHRDGMGRRRPGPQVRGCWWWTRCGAIMQHPEGAAFMVSMAKARPQAPAGVAVHHPRRAGPPLRGLVARHHRPLRQGALAERRLQAALAAGRRRHQHRGRTPSTCQKTSNAGCSRARVETGCCWRRDTASLCASRPPRRRRRSSSGDPVVTRSDRTTARRENR